MKIRSVITIGAMSLLLAGSSVFAQTTTSQTNKDVGLKRAAEVKKAAEIRHAEVKKAVETKKWSNEVKKADVKKAIKTKKLEIRRTAGTKKAVRKENKANEPVATSTVTQ